MNWSLALDGAGGIGGLLARSDKQKVVPAMLCPENPNPQNIVTSYYFSDNQGNITSLVLPNGFLVAQYKYDPFGNLISKSGLMAEINRYRFSSKEWEQNAGLYYYGYRFYDPNSQRWPNRDPLGELGFETLRHENGVLIQLMMLLSHQGEESIYNFVKNRPTDSYDYLGLDSADCALAIATLNGMLSLYNAGAASMADVIAAANAAKEACKPPPPPPPRPPWCPSPRWVPPYIPPPSPKQCTAVGVGGVILFFCIPWPGNPVFAGF
jgi:RHS repeat-associated protein